MNNQVIIEIPQKEILYLVLHVGIGERERDVLVSFKCEIHREILQKYQDELTSDDKSYLEVLGGGVIDFYNSKKKIVTYPGSKEFGPSPQEKTEILLKQEYPDYSIESKF